MYLHAFNDLSARRSYFMGGANPISVGDISAYAQLCGGFDSPTAKRVLFRHICAMDTTYLAVTSETAEARRKK